ncbi:MAG: hypothetical protein QG674_421 [Patescibacteria group bacterium]|jgi:hypothetical protein|nr:hypothetical protein [Patescibacteria group bacterium]
MKELKMLELKKEIEKLKIKQREKEAIITTRISFLVVGFMFILFLIISVLQGGR